MVRAGYYVNDGVPNVTAVRVAYYGVIDIFARNVPKSYVCNGRDLYPMDASGGGLRAWCESLLDC